MKLLSEYLKSQLPSNEADSHSVRGSRTDLGRGSAERQKESPAFLEGGAFGTPGQEWGADEEQRQAAGRFVVLVAWPLDREHPDRWELREMYILGPFPDQLYQKLWNLFVFTNPAGDSDAG